MSGLNILVDAEYELDRYTIGVEKLPIPFDCLPGSSEPTICQTQCKSRLYVSPCCTVPMYYTTQAYLEWIIREIFGRRDGPIPACTTFW